MTTDSEKYDPINELLHTYPHLGLWSAKMLAEGDGLPVFIDIETTGLRADERIVEIYAATVDSEHYHGVCRTEVSDYEPGALHMHLRSGLMKQSAGVGANTFGGYYFAHGNDTDMVEDFVKWAKTLAVMRNTPLVWVGRNPHFDHDRISSRLSRGALDVFSHRRVDMNTVSVLACSMRIEMPKPSATHRAKQDVLDEMAVFDRVLGYIDGTVWTDAP